MGRMAEKWQEQRQEREAREEEDFDWQAALKADPAFDLWLAVIIFEESNDDRLH